MLRPATVARTVLLYAVALAAGVFVLQWLEYRYLTRAYSTELYVTLVAVGFTGLGVWFGHRVTRRHAPPGEPFRRNEAAAAALGLTARECEILALLASGKSIKELGRELGVSPNTVKTHVASLYLKLDVQKRVNAIEKARELALIA